MFVVEITFPPINLKTSLLFEKKTYRSLRHASIELKVSYYFLYNCYHKQHNNQFTRFFNIYRVDRNGNKLDYKPPKKKKKRSDDLKQFKKTKLSQKRQKTETETKTQVRDKTEEEEHGCTHRQQYQPQQWPQRLVSKDFPHHRQRCGHDEKHNAKDDDTEQYVSKTIRCNQWKLWSFTN